VGFPRTAQLIESLNVGGAENLAVQIAGQLHERGCESHLIVLWGDGPLSDRIHPGVHVHYPDITRSSIANPFAFAGSIKSGLSTIADLLTQHEIQVLQTHLPGSNFWGLALALKKIVRVIPTIHNNQEFRYYDDDPALRVFLRRMAYYFVVRKGAATIAVSEAVKQSMLQQLWGNDALAERIIAVTNGVFIPELISDHEKQQVRQQFGVPDGVPLLVAAGRLDDQKNFGDLIASANLLHQRGVDFHLIIAGEGPHRQALEEAVATAGLSQKVQLPGVVDDIPRFFMSADLLVFSSLWEGLPLVLLEGMAAGLPTVGNAIDGLSEVLVDGEHGRLVKPRHVEAFADAVAAALADPDQLRQWGIQSRNLVTQKYNFTTMVDKIEALYRSVI
jgi:glycosyltransferase involved in cell wall biosynthesis